MKVKKQKTKIIFLCYHYIRRNDEFKRIWGHGLELFKKHIDFLKGEYPPISINELRLFLKGEINIPETCSVISFDDTLAEHARIIAPYLEKNGIRALFNVSTDVFKMEPLAPQVVHFGTAYYGIRGFSGLVKKYSLEKKIATEETLKFVEEEKNIEELHRKIKRFLKYEILNKDERDILLKIWHQDMSKDVHNLHDKVYMSKQEVVNLSKKGHEIGLHSATHALINDTTFNEKLFKDEISNPKKELEKLIDRPIEIFSYPYAYEADVIYKKEFLQRIKNEGFSMIFTIFNKDNSFEFNPDYIGRYSSNSNDDIISLKKKIWEYEISNHNK